MLTALLVFAMYQFQGVDSDQEITYNKFLKMIDEKKVEKVEIKRQDSDHGKERKWR